MLVGLRAAIIRSAKTVGLVYVGAVPRAPMLAGVPEELLLHALPVEDCKLTYLVKVDTL